MAARSLVAGPHPLDGAVHHGSSDAEEFGKRSLGVATGVVQLHQVLGLIRLQLRLLATRSFPAAPVGLRGPTPGAGGQLRTVVTADVL